MSSDGFWQRHLDKLGIGGSLVAALCCLGYPALLAIISSVGLGFLIRDAVLIPLLIAFLALALFGLYRGMQRHHRWQALGLASAGALVLLASIIFGNEAMAGIGISALVVASALNVWFAAHGQAV